MNKRLVPEWPTFTDVYSFTATYSFPYFCLLIEESGSGTLVYIGVNSYWGCINLAELANHLATPHQLNICPRIWLWATGESFPVFRLLTYIQKFYCL